MPDRAPDEPSESSTTDSVRDRSEPAETAPGAESDVVEAALATALARASAASQWGVVETLARELEARRVARGTAKPAGVIALDDERRRRGR